MALTIWFFGWMLMFLFLAAAQLINKDGFPDEIKDDIPKWYISIGLSGLSMVLLMLSLILEAVK